MVGFQAIYRCRLCGEKFNGTFTTNKDIALDSVMDVCIGTKNGSFSPLLYRLHFCEDGSYGLGDFLGRKTVEH